MSGLFSPQSKQSQGHVKSAPNFFNPVIEGHSEAWLRTVTAWEPLLAICCKGAFNQH